MDGHRDHGPGDPLMDLIGLQILMLIAQLRRSPESSTLAVYTGERDKDCYVVLTL